MRTRDGTASESSIQYAVGAVLLHTVEMGVDAGAISAALGTANHDIHWFDEAELDAYNLHTSHQSGVTASWRLEAYRGGLVLASPYRASGPRDIALALFCRREDAQSRLLVTEKEAGFASLVDDWPAQFVTGKWNNDVSELRLGSITGSLGPSNLEFFNLGKDGAGYLSVVLPSAFARGLMAGAGEPLHFDPNLARYASDAYFVRSELPGADWVRAAQNNCV